MFRNKSIFTKIVMILILFLLPIVILYSYSDAFNKKVIMLQIKESNVNQLSFFSSQVNNTVLQLETFSDILKRDPDIAGFQDLHLLNNAYEAVIKKRTILEKMNLQSTSAAWSNDITIYSPVTKEWISTTSLPVVDTSQFRNMQHANWTFVEYEGKASADAQFIHINVEPYNKVNDLTEASSLLEIRFAARNLIRMLDEFKSEGKGDPFYYQEGYRPLVNSTFQSSILDEVQSFLKSHSLEDKNESVIELQGISFLVTYVHVDSLDGYVVNVLPLKNILSPVQIANRNYYLMITLLLFISIVAAAILYRNVQLPIRDLVRGTEKIKAGNYSFRIKHRSQNEFEIIITRFNEMAVQIQQLIENVLTERIQVREAELKQLQSQINPHFLYNSIAYITSMTKLNKKEAVLQMAYHLSDYYRYTTQVQVQDVKLSEELRTANDYLSIHQMRMSRIHFVIEVDESMLDLDVPRLFLQPIIENALIHGIEKIEDDAWIKISGHQKDCINVLIVEDNGSEITDSDIDRIKKLLYSHSVTSSNDNGMISSGISNVHRRFQLRYGTKAGIYLSKSMLGGLKVEIRWAQKEDIL